MTSGSSSCSWERHEVLDGLIEVLPVGGFLLFTLSLYRNYSLQPRAVCVGWSATRLCAGVVERERERVCDYYNLLCPAGPSDFFLHSTEEIDTSQ